MSVSTWSYRSIIRFDPLANVTSCNCQPRSTWFASEPLSSEELNEDDIDSDIDLPSFSVFVCDMDTLTVTEAPLLLTLLITISA